MRRVICILLTFALTLSLAMPASASEAGESYYTVKVEFTDRVGQRESLRVMVKDGHVYADARPLALRLGYEYGEDDNGITILNNVDYNGLPIGITRFEYGSTKVSHMLFTRMVDTYEAPFACVRNDEGSWIPLEYSLFLLNSAVMVADDTLLIDIPSKRIIDYLYDVTKKSGTYVFDWADDFGYTETDVNVLGVTSHLVNVFNGALNLDGASWASLLQQFVGRMDSYDKKYGEDLALLLCTESDDELQATIDSVSMFIDLVSADGKLGEMLVSESEVLDTQVGVLYEHCEKVLKSVKSDNTPLVTYNRSYQALEKALDKQTWFSKTGGNILEVQKGLSGAVGRGFELLNLATKVLEVVGYGQEFAKQDTFSAPALAFYLETAEGGLELPQKMRQSMADYADSLSGFVGDYMTKRLMENVDRWVLDALPMHEALGMQAAGVLFAWNIASNTIPFISNGLSAADKYELALYSQVFQGDAHLNFASRRDAVFSGDGVSAESLYGLAQYCYVYLKTCYVTREAALASLEGKSKSTKEKIQPLIEKQDKINAEIAGIMVELKGANKTNKGHVFGFLPSDNEEYLRKYDDSGLINWLAGQTNAAYTQVISDEEDSAFRYTLTGKLHTHEEIVYDQSITVVSITLDSPIDYTYEYKGLVSATAREVELETSLSESFGKWSVYDGGHVTVGCEGLHGAIHDASMHGVDTLATGEIALISVDSPENSAPVGDVQAIRDASGKEVVWCQIFDFDSDGNKETFIIVGKPLPDEPEPRNYWQDGELWFMNSSGQVSKVAGKEVFSAYLMYVDMLGDGVNDDYTFLSLESTALGSGGKAHVYAVLNGNPVEVSFDQENVDFVHGEDGCMVGSISVFDNGYHQWQDYCFVFDETTLSFVTSKKYGDLR